MASTVRAIFAGGGLEPAGSVRWGEGVPLDAPGIYAVALTSDLGTTSAAHPTCPVSHAAVEELLRVRPELTVDGSRPSPAALEARVAAMWLADEVVLYVGLAGTSVRKRVDQYYRTPLGARKPHAGGWPIKTLSTIEELVVHYGAAADPVSAENSVLDTFMEAVSPTTRASVIDPALPLPFANLDRKGRGRKRHGIRGAREPHSRPPGRGVNQAPQPSQAPTTSDRTDHQVGPRSRKITRSDLSAGRIRFRGVAASILPPEPAYLKIDLRGQMLDARWRPGQGSRSGTVGVGRSRLEELVAEGDELLLVIDGERILLR